MWQRSGTECNEVQVENVLASSPGSARSDLRYIGAAAPKNAGPAMNQPNST